MGLGRLAAVALVVSGSISASPVVADACNPESLAASPSLVIRTGPSPEQDAPGIRIESEIAGVLAILASFESASGRLDELLLTAERAPKWEQVAPEPGAAPPSAKISISSPELRGRFSYLMSNPPDPESLLVVRLYFDDGSVRAFSVCEASATAQLTVTASAGPQGKRPGPRPPGQECYCVRLECSGTSVCSLEKECCGEAYAACACCSCGSNHSCQITCPPCDQVP